MHSMVLQSPKLALAVLQAIYPHKLHSVSLAAEYYSFLVDQPLPCTQADAVGLNLRNGIWSKTDLL